MNTLKYKGYTGSVEYNGEEKILFGRVLGIRHVIDYEGESIPELEQDFRNAIDSYLSVCKEEGIRPNKPRSGKITLTLPPEVQASLDHAVETTGQSADQLVVNAVRMTYLGASILIDDARLDALSATGVKYHDKTQTPAPVKQHDKPRRREKIKT